MLDDVILPAIRTFVETTINDAGVAVICYTDERVPPRFGSRLVVNVFPGGINSPISPDWQLGSEFLYGFTVGITDRTGDIPTDRLFDAAMASRVSPLGRTIFDGLQAGRYDLQSAINAALATAAPGWSMAEPFQYRGRGIAVKLVGPEHFFAEPDAANVRTDCGLWGSLEFGSGRFLKSHLV